MNNKKWITYGVWILIAEAVGALSGLLSRTGMMVYGQTAIQPSFAPPAAVFPVVWGILYALMGIGAARIWMSEDSLRRRKSLNLYVAQLTVNFFWSLVFFNLQAYGLAFFWLLLLWLLVAWMIYSFYKIDRLAALLQIPYLLWLTLAAVLNGAVWYLNR